MKRLVVFLVILGGMVMVKESLAQNQALKVVKLKFINAEAQVDGIDSSVYDVSIDNDKNIYVADYRHNNILILNQELEEIGKIEGISKPHGVHVDVRDGSIYVSTWADGRIFKYNKNREAIADWDKDLVATGGMKRPAATTTDQQGNVYVADYDAQTILKASADGKFIKAFDVASVKANGKFLPHSITTDGKSVFVSDRSHMAVQMFTVDGQYVRAFDEPDGNFEPLSVRFINNKLLGAVNYKNDTLRLYDPNGKYLKSIGQHGASQGEFMVLTNLAPLNESTVILVEQNSNRVQKVDLSEQLKDVDAKP